MKVALVTTVLNERELLRTNLLYHRRLGVAHALVFDDGSTDGTSASLADLPFVTVLPGVDPGDYAERPGLAVPASRAATDYASRQILNAQRALDLAREQGYDWLIHLDPDELLVTAALGALPGSLLALLGRLPQHKEAVSFPALEAVQSRLEYQHVFGEETLFKRPSGRLRRSVPDPYTGGRIGVGDFFGHRIGKWAVRVGAAAYPASVHAFRGPEGRELRVAKRGALLHYYSHGFADFARKHRALPERDHYASGMPVEPHKVLWRRLAKDPDWSDARLREYYERHVLFREDEIRRLRRTRRFGFWPVEPAIVELTAVRDALGEMGLLDTPGPGSG